LKILLYRVRGNETIYKVKVTIQIGGKPSESYAEIDTTEDGVDEGKEVEVLFESVQDCVKERVKPNQNDI
jgi:hypothetical protein